MTFDNSKRLRRKGGLEFSRTRPIRHAQSARKDALSTLAWLPAWKSISVSQLATLNANSRQHGREVHVLFLYQTSLRQTSYCPRAPPPSVTQLVTCSRVASPSGVNRTSTSVTRF